jgi:hypothetical protein
MVTSADDIMLDLDALERDQVRGLQKAKPPFRFKVNGRPVTLADPADIDSLALMTMEETPQRFFRTTCTDVDYLFMLDVLETPGAFPGYKFRALMQQYHTYYGLDDPGNAGGSRR